MCTHAMHIIGNNTIIRCACRVAAQVSHLTIHDPINLCILLQHKSSQRGGKQEKSIKRYSLASCCSSTSWGCSPSRGQDKRSTSLSCSTLRTHSQRRVPAAPSSGPRVCTSSTCTPPPGPPSRWSRPLPAPPSRWSPQTSYANEDHTIHAPRERSLRSLPGMAETRTKWNGIFKTELVRPTNQALK